MRLATLIIVGLATACARNDGPPAYHLDCAAMNVVSYSSLRAAYGPANVVDETLQGAEGEPYQATVVYPNDPSRRLEIVWREGADRSAPSLVRAPSFSTAWIGPNGARVGQTLTDIEAANGLPFTLWGFGWDYGGWVSDWNDGALDDMPDGCIVQVLFAAAPQAQHNAIGDREFASDSDAMRGADARVSEVALSFGRAPN